MRVLYGGSVKPDNARELHAMAEREMARNTARISALTEARNRSIAARDEAQTALCVAENALAALPPSAELEMAVEEAQRDPLYRQLNLPHLKVTAKVPTDVLEHLCALYAELRRQRSKPTATPEEARQANAELRRMMRERGNYFASIEQVAAAALAAAGYAGGALSQGMLLSGGISWMTVW